MKEVFVEKQLDLNDINVENFDISQDEFAEGHGLTEIGASSQTGDNSCGQGSCKTATEVA
jgi:hypothetical protein